MPCYVSSNIGKIFLQSGVANVIIQAVDPLGSHTADRAKIKAHSGAFHIRISTNLFD